MRKTRLLIVGLLISFLSFFLPAIAQSDLGLIGKLAGTGGQIILFLVGVCVAVLPYLEEIYRAIISKGIFVTTTHRQNWEKALSLANGLRPGDEAYDTTSVMNEPEFEKAVRHAVIDNKATYYRIFCCAPDDYNDKSSPYRLFMEMLEPQRVQSSRDNEWVRVATSAQRLRMYHLPYTVHFDFLVIAHGYTALWGLFGFATKGPTKTYVSGISFDNKELARALRDFYVGNLIEQAKTHQALVREGKVQCFCRDFLPPNQTVDFLQPK